MSQDPNLTEAEVAVTVLDQALAVAPGFRLPMTIGDHPPEDLKGTKRLKWYLRHERFVARLRLPRTSVYEVASFLEEVDAEVELAAQRVPTIARCSGSSMQRAIAQLGRWGLSLMGKQAYLVPFWNSYGGKKIPEVTLMVSWMGLQAIAERGGVRKIASKLVYEREPFEEVGGLNPTILHNILPPAERGEKIKAVYAVANLANGEQQFEVMWAADVEKIRAQTKARNKGKESPAWLNNEGEMYRKTATRRLCKRIPIALESKAVLEEMYRAEAAAEVQATPTYQDLSPHRLSEPVEEVAPVIEVEADEVVSDAADSGPTKDGAALSDSEIEAVRKLMAHAKRSDEPIQKFLDDYEFPLEDLLTAARDVE